jgi:hypothetical protein
VARVCTCRRKRETRTNKSTYLTLSVRGGTTARVQIGGDVMP